MAYQHKEIEKKWQRFWEENQTFKTSSDHSMEKFFAMDMFPFPSGQGLHVGHPEGYTATDIVSRMKRMQGFNVLHPMGFDAFGLPTEEYAIKTGEDPRVVTAKNVKNFRRQMKTLGLSYDWSREVNTTDPKYYKWTQWIFEQLYKKGLAYEDEIMVNINYKSDGIINRDEVSNDPDVKPKDAVKVGDEIDVYIMKHDDGEGNVVLSLKRVAALKNWDIVEEIFNNKSITEARVLNAVKGGLTVLVNGVDGFMPASHASLSFESDLSKFKGQTFKVRVIDFDKDKRRIIVSKKVVDKEELEKKQAEVWENLEVNKMIVGTVQRLTDFGAFVDLGGVDGLIHVSDLSWNRVKHPSEVLKEGDKVEVMVLSLDKAKNRISLGLKQTIQEPWTVFKNTVSIGDVVEGKVVNLLDFGAFVRLESGVDGLLHVSQISKEHVNKPSDVLKIGDTVEVAVIEVNEDERRISLSAKQAAAKDETPVETEVKPEAEAEEVVEIKNEDLDTTIGDIINKK